MLSFHQEKYETLGEGEKNFVHNVDICGELRAWINEHKAGSPTDADVYWIHFRPIEISKAFFEASSHRVSHGY